MTTGEKIAKLRKEKGLTQEDFGDLLGVTRQSVSKWEQDISFPETDKLILIAREFNCSLDYLLNNEYNHNNNQNTEEVIENKRVLKGNLFYAIVIMSFAVTMLLLYFLPLARIPVQDGFISQFPHEYYVTFNFYNFVFSTSYKFGNFIILLHYLCTLFILGIGVLSMFFEDKRIYKASFISSIVSLGLMLIIFITIVILNISVGALLLTLLNISYFVFIIIYRRKKKCEKQSV